MKWAKSKHHSGPDRIDKVTLLRSFAVQLLQAKQNNLPYLTTLTLLGMAPALRMIRDFLTSTVWLDFDGVSEEPVGTWPRDFWDAACEAERLYRTIFDTPLFDAEGDLDD